MKDTLEIRWHGRGGQGVKTAALLLADVTFNTGKYIQGFPEYGPERMGAPVTAYNRISNQKNLVHSNIYEPDYVVVVDETLLKSVDVSNGLNPEGGILINTSRTPNKIKEQLRGYEGKIYTIDANGISAEILGTSFPNMPMLAAIVKVTGVMEEKVFMNDMGESLNHKFANKQYLAVGNMEVLRKSFREVRSQ